MICPSCGASIAAGARFCASCGVPLSGGATAVSSSAPGADATRLGVPADEPGAADATMMGAPSPLETDATRLGVPADALDANATQLGLSPGQFDADATRPGVPADALDANATRLGVPADPDATVLGTPADADSTRLGVPAGDMDADATRLGGPFQPAGAGTRPGTRPPSGSRTGGTGGTGGAKSGGAAGSLEVGQAFGQRYHIIRMLGVGGMGAVYQAWDSELEVALALKVIRPEATADPVTAAEVERRFKQELLLARQVTHPNVVRIHDLGEIDGIKYITMPYVEGTDLAGILAETPTLPVPRVLNIAKQVAAGLQAAHAAGVVHRDLKPANIMIDREGTALIMDFGIARSSAAGGASEKASGAGISAPTTHEGTRLGTIVGTIEYMAPEQARGQPVDQRADIYTFGLILYRLLAGKPRFSDTPTDPITEMRTRIETEPPRLRTVDPSIPEAVEEIVSTCVQPDADKRFRTTADLVAALESLDENGIPKPLPKQIIKSWKFWAAAATLMLALTGSTWWITQWLAPPPSVEHDPVPVLVADFTNTTGEGAFDGLIEQSLRVGIESASFITAYQRPAALDVARKINAGTTLTEQTARLVAGREGVKVVLIGGIEKRGSGYAISVRGIDPSGQVLFSSSAKANNRDAVLQATSTLSSNVRKALGDTQPTADRENLSTGSLDAVSDYTKAQDLSTAGRDEEAIAYYKRATERDPNFGRAWGGWALSATRLGRKSEAELLWKQALAHLEGMTDRERYRLLGVYYRQVARNYDKAMDNYLALVKQYPADGHGLNNLAIAYFEKLDFKQALEQGQRVLKIYPNSPLYRGNYALYAMYAGDFDTATTAAQQLVADKQAAYDTYLPLAMAAMATGDNAAARAAYAEMAATGVKGRSLAATGLADLALYEGDAKAALAQLKSGMAEDQASGNTVGLAGKQMLVAEALTLQGNAKGAAATARQALNADDSDGVQIPAANMFLAARATAEAARIGEVKANRLEPRTRAYGRLISGQIALAQGHQIEAVEEFRQAIKLADLWLIRFNLGRAFLEAGAFAEALGEFEACAKRRGEATAVFLDDVPSIRYLATVPYWAGRSQEGLGLLPQAQENYRKFLAPKTTDSSDPLVKDARRRLGGQ